MAEEVDRRAPGRHMVAVRLLRRIAVMALVLSALLLAGPRLLREIGVFGPTAEEEIRLAEGSLAIARSYGASSGLAPFRVAERELESARQLAGAGQVRAARRAAEQASRDAVEAQKLALVARTMSRQRAQTVYTDLDRQINDLEKLYSAVTPGLQKEQVGQLLSLMKVTRATAGALFLAYEQEDYEGVLQDEARARGAVTRARSELQAAGK